MKQLKTPVALIFFTRPDTFEKDFEQVRKAKPEKLFLIQDGAREGRPDDVKKIEECRKIAENIDWECEVYKNYSDVNLGCGVRPSSGITWVFEYVDKAIILEDDCVPCETFFDYCEEMLDRYENDERIAYVSGLNHFADWDCGDYSYFFTKTGAIWGWATWKRAWQKYDYRVNAINDDYLRNILRYQITSKFASERRIKKWIEVNKNLKSDNEISYWDVQWGLVKYSQNQLVIVPKYNQISNIGVGVASSHAQNTNHSEFKKYKTFFHIPVKKLELPLKHQTSCVCDVEYDNLVYKCTYGNPTIHRLKSMVKKMLRWGK